MGYVRWSTVHACLYFSCLTEDCTYVICVHLTTRDAKKMLSDFGYFLRIMIFFTTLIKVWCSAGVSSINSCATLRCLLMWYHMEPIEGFYCKRLIFFEFRSHLKGRMVEVWMKFYRLSGLPRRCIFSVVSFAYGSGVEISIFIFLKTRTKKTYVTRQASVFFNGSISHRFIGSKKSIKNTLHRVVRRKFAD